jgi:hypothetical protein
MREDVIKIVETIAAMGARAMTKTAVGEASATLLRLISENWLRS